MFKKLWYRYHYWAFGHFSYEQVADLLADNPILVRKWESTPFRLVYINILKDYAKGYSINVLSYRYLLTTERVRQMINAFVIKQMLNKKKKVICFSK